MSTPEHTALLDQLQTQVNLVLEQTGRVFAAVNASPNSPTAGSAQVSKLKQVLPIASSRFHQALDQLENELHMATMVMRRDLAVCREQSGQKSTQMVPEPTSEALLAEELNADAKISRDSVPAETVGKEDVAMPDLQEQQKTDVDEKPAEAKSLEDAAPPQPVISPKDAKPSAASDPVPANSEEASFPLNPNGDLQLGSTSSDTKAEQPPPEEKAPDTATGDLDSLFNDNPPTTTEDATTFNFDQTTSNDLDFDAFNTNFDASGADNDNISSLLPGLEDYANTQSNPVGDTLDFNSIFDVGGDGSGMDHQGGGEQGDTTFDDLLNMTYEGMDGDENGGGNGNGNAELDFEALFS